MMSNYQTTNDPRAEDHSQATSHHIRKLKAHRHHSEGPVSGQLSSWSRDGRAEDQESAHGVSYNNRRLGFEEHKKIERWAPRRRTKSGPTIHNEQNGVPVSSDDSSDDDDVISRASRSTIHQEANGIWVSSDDSDDDYDVSMSQASGNVGQGADPRFQQRRVAHRRHNPIARRLTRTASMGPALSYKPGYSSDYSASSGTPSSHGKLSRRALRLDPAHAVSNGSKYRDLNSGSPHSHISSSSSTTARTNSSYWSSSGSEAQSPSSGSHGSRLRRRRNASEMLRTYQNQDHQANYSATGYDSMESISLSSRAERRSYASNQISYDQQRSTPHPLLRSNSMPTPETKVQYESFQSEASTPAQALSYETSKPSQRNYYEETPQPKQGIQLHAVQFWDPDGSKACNAERLIFGGGIMLTMTSFLWGSYIGGFVLMVVTALCSSYLTTMYRILSWRKKSGIEHHEAFSGLYEMIEHVATDTRTMTATGIMKPRLICAGEIGDAINRHAPFLDEQTKLTFWVEACAHFRLTLRGGCHHLGRGKLQPKTLTSASLSMLTSTLPRTICPSCDNKIAIESKFPLKCD